MSLNRFQPHRDRVIEETGEFLRFRRHPDMRGRIYPSCKPKNMFIQMIIYRWSRSQNFRHIVTIDELHYHLFREHPTITKRAMGLTILNAVNYDPRKQIMVRNKNRSSYVFVHRLDLVYGLEWMICAWLRRLYNENLPLHKAKLSSADEVQLELDFLGEGSESQVLEEYLESIFESSLTEPDWAHLLYLHPEAKDAAPI